MALEQMLLGTPTGHLDDGSNVTFSTPTKGQRALITANIDPAADDYRDPADQQFVFAASAG